MKRYEALETLFSKVDLSFVKNVKYLKLGTLTSMTKRAIFLIIIGLIGLAIGIFAMSPYNETGPYSHIIGGGLQFALLLCGLGILSISLGLWLARRSK
jgi:hypothetical protein